MNEENNMGAAERLDAIAGRARPVPVERLTADERLQAVRDRTTLVTDLRAANAQYNALVELAREMMLALEAYAPDALRDIPRRIMARVS